MIPDPSEQARGPGDRHGTLAALRAVGRLLRLLPGRIHRQFYGTAILMIAGAIAEMVTVGAALPFLILVAGLDPSRLPDWPIVEGLTTLWGAALLLVTAAITASALRLVLAWKTLSFVTRVGQEVATAILDRTLRQSFAVHVQTNSSETLARIEKVHGIVFAVMQPAMQGIAAVTLAAFVSALLIWLSPMASLTAILLLALTYGAIAVFVRPFLRQSADQQAAALPLRTRTAQEAIGGIRDIILDGSADQFRRRFRAFDAAHRFAQARVQFISTAPRYVLEGAAIAAIAGATLLITPEAGKRAEVLPVLGTLAVGAQRLLPLLQQAYHSWSQLGGNARDVFQVLAAIETPVPPTTPEARALPLRKQIELNDVSYRYPNGGFALSNVTLRLAAGDWLGICGASGSGKSTLLDLLMGLLAPDEGVIRIDGRPLTQESLRGWQNSIAHVPQSAYLTDDCILANIVFPPSSAPPDEGRLERAIRDAHLEDLVRRLDAGLQAGVGERGVLLSGGERQRIALARALYRNPELLILDEALNALDEDCEVQLLHSLRLARPALTVALVAHRTSTLTVCDSIACLENGTLVSTPAFDTSRLATGVVGSFSRRG
jgi:ABC-type multidrug transport system fused ATPase/permease subunit